MCPYHGWRYRADGRCAAIPQLEDPTRVPAKARIPAFRATERFGLIWVALEEPRFELPDAPELATATAGSSSTPARTGGRRTPPASSRTSPTSATSPGCTPACWATPSGRSCRSTASRPRATCCTTGSSAPRRPTRDDFPVFGNEDEQAPERRSRYQLHLPYTIVLRLGWGGEKGMLYFFASQPVSDSECVGYVVIGRNYDLDQPPEVLQ